MKIDPAYLEDVQNACVIVAMHRLGLKTMTFDEEELVQASKAIEDEDGEVSIEFHCSTDLHNIMVKLG